MRDRTRTGCIVGRLVPAAGPPLGCPLPQPGKGHHGWGHREKGQPRLARRCRGAGSDAAEHLSSWTAVPRAQLHSEAGAPTVQCGQARCHPCHVRLNKSIRTSPAPTLCWEAVTGEHRAHRHRTASPPGWQPHTPTGRTHLA